MSFPNGQTFYVTGTLKVKGETPGIVNVSLGGKDGNGNLFSGTLTVNVTPNVTISPDSATLDYGNSATEFQATGDPSGGTYTWTATGGEIWGEDGCGEYTPNDVGLYEVEVEYEVNGQKGTDGVSVTVNPTVAVSPATTTVTYKDAVNLTATGNPDDETAGSCNWSCSAQHSDSTDGVSGNGKTATFTPPDADIYTVTVAYSMNCAGGSDKATITVNPNLKSLNADPVRIPVNWPDEPAALTAVASPEGGDFAWSCGDLATFMTSGVPPTAARELLLGQPSIPAALQEKTQSPSVTRRMVYLQSRKVFR